MRQLWKLSGAIGAGLGGRKYPFVFSHSEPSEAPGCLSLTWVERYPKILVLMHAWLVLGS